MKNLFFFGLLLMGSLSVIRGQEIIPFPDLSESHIAVYNQSSLGDVRNYSYYTEDYQNMLRKIDLDIDVLNEKIEATSDAQIKKRLTTEKASLIKNRLSLLNEADLVEDLNKFY